jgi:hypothetical protein
MKEADDRITYTHCDSSSCLRKLAGDYSSSEKDFCDASPKVTKMQKKFMKIVEKMIARNVPLPAEFELYYKITKYVDDDLTSFRVTPFLSETQAEESLKGETKLGKHYMYCSDEKLTDSEGKTTVCTAQIHDSSDVIEHLYPVIGNLSAESRREVLFVPSEFTNE